MLVSTKTHGVIDYATAGALLGAPALLRGADLLARLALTVAGGGILATSLLTDYELGARRVVPMKVHLALDAATGAGLLAAPFLLGAKGAGIGGWLPHLLAGAGEVAAALLTEREPGDRSPAAGAPAEAEEPPAALSPRSATPPIETPGPSVPAPKQPASETEAAEWAEANVPDMEFLAPTSVTDPLVAEEEAAAAAEAALIGGVVPHDSDDPAMDPVYQAGGGEGDGFELAEADLIENATHGDGHGNPLRDAFGVEAESDLAGVEYGEGDHVHSTELLDDPETGPGPA